MIGNNTGSRLEKILEQDFEVEDLSFSKRKVKSFFTKPFRRGVEFFLGYSVYKGAKDYFEQGWDFSEIFNEGVKSMENFGSRFANMDGLLEFGHGLIENYESFLPYLGAGVLSMIGSYTVHNISKKWGVDPLIAEMVRIRKRDILKNYKTVKERSLVGRIPSAFLAFVGLWKGDYRKVFDDFISYQKKERNNFVVNSVLCDLYVDAMLKNERVSKVEEKLNKIVENGGNFRGKNYLNLKAKIEKMSQNKRYLNAKEVTDKYGGLVFYHVLLKRYLDGLTRDKIKTGVDNTTFHDGLMYELVKNKIRKYFNSNSAVLKIQSLSLKYIASDYKNFRDEFEQLLDYNSMKDKIKLIAPLNLIDSEDKGAYEGRVIRELQFGVRESQLLLLNAYADNLALVFNEQANISYENLGQSAEVFYNIVKKMSYEGSPRIKKKGDSKNPVYFYTEESELKQMVFKESASYESLRKEFIVTLKRRDMLRDLEFVKIVEPIVITQVHNVESKSYVYLNRLIKGNEIDDIIKDNSANLENSFENIIRYSAIMHSHEFEPNLENRYLAKEVKQKFSGESISEIVFEIIDSLSVLNNFAKHEKSVVLDLHGGNFMVGIDEKLYAIDHERNYVSVVTDDLSRFFHLVNGRVDYYGNRQKKIEYGLLKEIYLNNIVGDKIHFEGDRFDLCFLKSNIRNTFSLYSYFSKRSEVHKILNKYLIGASLDSIECIRGNFGGEYNAHKEQYDRIQGALVRINHTITE